ncbi:hypothetical protein [Neoaquamicrobium sediminum]|uniref:Response regulatory domain-containing protein n=1 Tax=Neoaquamicrobium sediminum TaxID=1849104 RepID=A0ABV3WVI7_9HYPH
MTLDGSAIPIAVEKVALHPQHKVLVVVPDPELRRSVEFALEAEGFRVDSHALLAAALQAATAGQMVCSVVDENAVSGRSGIADRLDPVPRPIVLLVDRLRNVPETTSQIAILTKPLLGRRLVDTVVALVGNEPKASAT